MCLGVNIDSIGALIQRVTKRILSILPESFSHLAGGGVTPPLSSFNNSACHGCRRDGSGDSRGWAN